jgi:hypothetical protein
MPSPYLIQVLVEVAMILHVPKTIHLLFINTKRKTNSKARILCFLLSQNIYFVYFNKKQNSKANTIKTTLIIEEIAEIYSCSNL